jgi:ketosteroid isomerase-like protein
MRTILTLRCCLALLASAALAGSAACSSDNVGSPPAAPVDWHAFDIPRSPDAGAVGPTANERAVPEKYLTALAAPGVAPLTPQLDADVHFTFPGLLDARGREAVVRAHDSLFGAFDQRAFALSRVWRTDSVNAVEWTMSGVQSKDWMGVAATHKPLVLKGIALLWTKDDGTITEIHVIFDVTAAKAQLGAGPKELAGLAPPTMASGAAQVTEQTRTADEAANVTVARAWLDALERPDDASYVAVATDDVIVETLEHAPPMHGKDELKAYFKGLHKGIGQIDTTVDSAAGVGRFALVEYTINGEQLGPIAWIPAQHDRVVRLHVIDVAEIRDGKIAHVWRYDNPAEILASGS